MTSHHEPPQLPVVVDEAGDSPRWLPFVGLGLLCLITLVVAARQAMGPDVPETAAGAADTADGGTAQAAAPEAPAEKPAQPAPAVQRIQVGEPAPDRPVEVRVAQPAPEKAPAAKAE